MKGKIVAIMVLSAVALTLGVSEAYCNTRVRGFDENAKLIEVGENKIKFMDFDINYGDAEEILKKASKYVPKAHNIVDLDTV